MATGRLMNMVLVLCAALYAGSAAAACSDDSADSSCSAQEAVSKVGSGLLQRDAQRKETGAQEEVEAEADADAEETHASAHIKRHHAQRAHHHAHAKKAHADEKQVGQAKAKTTSAPLRVKIGVLETDMAEVKAKVEKLEGEVGLVTPSSAEAGGAEAGAAPAEAPAAAAAAEEVAGAAAEAAAAVQATQHAREASDPSSSFRPNQFQQLPASDPLAPLMNGGMPTHPVNILPDQAHQPMLLDGKHALDHLLAAREQQFRSKKGPEVPLHLADDDNLSAPDAANMALLQQNDDESDDDDVLPKKPTTQGALQQIGGAANSNSLVAHMMEEGGPLKARVGALEAEVSDYRSRMLSLLLEVKGPEEAMLLQQNHENHDASLKGRVMTLETKMDEMKSKVAALEHIVSR